MTRLVERLEREGLVERRRDGFDSRTISAVITDRGLERLAEATPTHLAGVRARFLDPLSDADVLQLAHIWRRLLAPMR